jgi:hypothetical protein
MRLFEELTDEDKLEAAQAFFIQKEDRKKKQRRYASIKNRLGGSVNNTWFYLAAAVVLGLVASLVWFTIPQTKEKQHPPITARATSDTARGIILTATDGRKIVLDSSGHTRVPDGTILEPGALRYLNTGKEGFNTVSVPTGRQFTIYLPDGTKVWLNCESSLTYPVSFTGMERKVQLSGEGYFEVTHNPGKPFIVLSNQQNVTVLGTHFNIKDYEGEKSSKTTLTEGKVKVDRKLFTAVLQPGEQAVSTEKGIQVAPVDVEEELAWKDGMFLFRNETIESVAAQISRWYGVEIEYAGAIKGHFNATVSRKESIERLLRVLEGTGFVHFSFTGNKLVISP